MSKRKKIKSERQLLLEKNVYQIQLFEQPPSQPKKFVRTSHYMLQHENYKKLLPNAKVALLYMIDWAFSNEEFIETQKFDFSTTMLTTNGIMSNKTAISALQDLEHYGFIQKENNACKYSGITQKWSFSNEWYMGKKREW